MPKLSNSFFILIEVTTTNVQATLNALGPVVHVKLDTKIRLMLRSFPEKAKLSEK